MTTNRSLTMPTALATVVLCLLTSACSRNTDDPFYRSGLVYCSESNPASFNPQLDTSSTTIDASAHQLYDRLIDVEPQTGQLIPGLATHWRVSDDGLSYQFFLRKGVAFHDTYYFSPSREFTAEDVVFSINRWRLASHPYHQVSGGRYPYFESINLGNKIKDVVAVDDHRVDIRLHTRDSSFLANLATDFAVILSAEYAENLLAQQQPENIDNHPIGTGPFIFGSYRKDQYIRYHSNPGYWSKTQQADTLVFDITSASSLRLAKMISGECDAIAFPAQTELEVIRNHPELHLEQSPGLNVGFWAFNTQKPPFDNEDVRRALAYAIDKNTLIEAVYLNNAVRAKALLPAASWAHQNDADDTAYNPVYARQLLANAELENGFDMTIWAMPVTRDYNPNALKMAELIQRYLSDIGINASIQTYDWASFRRRLAAGEHDSVLIGWSADNGDPDNFYRPLLSCDAIQSGTNRAFWCNPDYDRILDQALMTEDLEQRQGHYNFINRLLFEKMPLVPIAHAYRYQAYRKDIVGIKINPYGGVRFAGVYKP